MAKRRNERSQPAARIEPVISDPLETDSGALQPFIKIFRYDPENATRESLGTLLGIFEIGSQSESTAYIVNFIASVAKKEYFSQPRRTPSESLEATLHKINRALAELVKHGNTEWLGSLRAAVCVLEGNSIHFSVTGNACILLIRNGIASDIGEGFSPEEAAFHPLKTFTDTASGRLQKDDTFVITTPGLFEILPLQEIEKAARRFPGERFIQFLRTAIVNQLVFGGAFVVTTREVIAPPKKKNRGGAHRADSAETLPNVFSQQVFSEARHAKAPSPSSPRQSASERFSEQAPADYVDSQTGHIYVQGEAPYNTEPTSARREQLRLITEEWTFRLRQISRTGQYRVRSITFNMFNESRLLLSRGASLAHASLRKIRLSRRSPLIILPDTEAPTIPGTKSSVRETSAPQPATHIPVTEATEKSTSIESISRTIGISAASVGHALRSTLLISTRFVARQAKNLVAFMLARYRSLEKKYQSAVLAGIAILVSTSIWAVVSVLSKPEPVAVVQESAPAPVVIIEPELVAIDSLDSITSRNDIIRVHTVGGRIVSVGKTILIVSEENGTSKEAALPSDAGTIVQSASMPAIGTIFLLTDRGKLLSFAPANRTFTENTIALPDTKTITAITGYSSYLYVLNAPEQRIVRYPRTEGGFGPGVEWLKSDAAPIVADATTLAVAERLFTASKQHVDTFSRGRHDESLRFADSTTPITFDALSLLPERNALAVLDTHFGRIVLFDLADGHIIRQYAHETLKQATGLAADESRSRVVLATPKGSFSFSIAQ